ncbi:SIS domain-containing protein [Salinarimonas ramus]|uniref:Glucosamine-6-phosphate deaminase n=1 Tax=Salinarimonas ramus TaxID=690164 RepID=A0A917QBF5_9HYPH|nr:SIS domain-containing protein [Salinarimonas ramus]GGK41290.1 glucosamine-6-phosphate deaminase [Salinarimonas ramus]
MTTSLMRAETDEASAVVARALACERETLARIGRRLADAPPPLITTAARGSSDNAVSVFEYLSAIVLGIPVASIGPSVASAYGARLRLEGAVHISVSQSGASPDIIALQKAAREGGATTIALVNVADSPLAAGADLVVPLHAGEEKSVAATKTCLASAALLAGIVAAASGDATLAAGLAALPEALAAPSEGDVEGLVEGLVAARSLFVLGRGPGYGVAREAALKAKETAALHAEAISLAEVQHGPKQLVAAGFPVLAFVADDAARAASERALDGLAGQGAQVRVVGPVADPSHGGLRTAATGAPLLDPLVALCAFYRVIEQAARARGHDPDAPSHLAKVTRTV